jgi:hypothetical protein
VLRGHHITSRTTRMAPLGFNSSNKAWSVISPLCYREETPGSHGLASNA